MCKLKIWESLELCQEINIFSGLYDVCGKINIINILQFVICCHFISQCNNNKETNYQIYYL